MGSTMNPWHVTTLDEFLFYCCPECDMKCRDHTEFFNHAVQVHELAKEALNGTEVKMELDLEVDEEVGNDILDESQLFTNDEEHGQDIMAETNLFTNDEDFNNDIESGLINIPKQEIAESTFKKYKRTWQEFLNSAKVNFGNEPTKEDFESYFIFKRENGVAHGTLKALYSHLSKMFKMMHNKELDNFHGGSIKRMLESWQEDPKRPDKRLTKAQIIQFLKEADDSDRYLLVRKVIAMLAYLGGLKLSMLRMMTLGSVKPHPKGYAVHMNQDVLKPYSKNQQVEETVCFIVPQGGDDGVCYASIMRTFLDALAKDQLDLHPDVPLFRQGKRKTASTPSTFTSLSLGKNNLYNVGKEVAQFLKLPDYLEYSTKSFLVSTSVELFSSIPSEKTVTSNLEVSEEDGYDHPMDMKTDFITIKSDDDEEDVKPLVKFEDVKLNQKVEVKLDPLAEDQLHNQNIEPAESEKIFTCDHCGKTFDNYMKRRRHVIRDHGMQGTKIQCDQCGKKFSKKTNLQRHILVVHEGKNHSCHICNKEFKTWKNFQHHLENVMCAPTDNEGNSAFACERCHKSFNTSTKLEMHKKTAKCIPFDEQSLKCKICDTQLKSKQTYREHMHDMHEAKRIFCEYCAHNVLENRFAEHVEKCEISFKELYEGNEFQCDQCRRSFKLIAALKSHQKNMHSNEEFKCTYCKKTYASKRLRDDHIREKHEVKVFKCELCDETFDMKRKMMQHMETIHKDCLNTCDYCGKKFFSQDEFKDHICKRMNELNIPRPEKPYFDCEVCSAKLATVIDLRDHMVVFHQSQQIYCEFCGKHAPTQKFYEHVENCEIVWREKYANNIHKCKACRRSWNDESTMRSHYRMVHKKVKYQCEHCSQEFSCRNNLKEHIQCVHQGLLIYCEHCGQSFKSSQNLRYHMKRNHDYGQKLHCERCGRSFVNKGDFRHHNCEKGHVWSWREGRKERAPKHTEDQLISPKT